MSQVLSGFWKQFIHNFILPTWACAAGCILIQPGCAGACAAGRRLLLIIIILIILIIIIISDKNLLEYNEGVTDTAFQKQW